MEIKIKKCLGEKLAVEDAIIVRDMVEKNIQEEVVLDFEGFKRIPSTFLCCLFTDLINKQGRDYIFNQVNVKNLSNYEDYTRVVKGTAYTA
ncbi:MULTISPECIES: STAS-like domain-containing protein [Clostridium]|uniref:STAS-like domain-containing protein n=1 Tax=Clostridium paridis TaxID=2803863 RepID=A0A937FFL6_9CLOT|nr:MULTISPECIES: STAS-like domain-containing protein [Clostridium]MBL4931397.1 STAS-like domain-containing protein [Clostridium paridis]